jgi:hypothetical protein
MAQKVTDWQPQSQAAAHGAVQAGQRGSSVAEKIFSDSDSMGLLDSEESYDPEYRKSENERMQKAKRQGVVRRKKQLSTPQREGELRGLMIQHKTDMEQIILKQTEDVLTRMNEMHAAMHEQTQIIKQLEARDLKGRERMKHMLSAWSEDGDALEKTIFPIIWQNVSDALGEPNVQQRLKRIKAFLKYIWLMQMGITSKDYAERIRSLVNQNETLEEENETLKAENDRLRAPLS